MTTRPIGGFLPLRLPLRPSPTNSVLAAWIPDGAQSWLLHNARSALHALWEQLRPGRIWLPAYICTDVASAISHGTETRYYPLDRSLVPSADFLATEIRSGDHVLGVDYFGRPVPAEFQSLVRARPDVGWIEDRAQALDPGESAWGDWVLYSPRKVVGVPDGGILVAHRKPLPSLATIAPTDFSFVLPYLERFEDDRETDNARWYAHYRHTESALQVGRLSMSRISLAILAASDIHEDADRRRRNYQALHERLGEWALFPDSSVSYAPLGFPLQVKSGMALSEYLAARRIFAARHWPALPSDPRQFADAHSMAEKLVTLPCDYRYSEQDMRRVADTVREAMSATT